MWELWIKLLDLDELRDAEPGSISLRFQTPWSDWVVLLTVILSVLFVALTYDRERVRPRLRVTLALLRASLVLLAVALLCRPVLVWERTRDEPSVAALMMDVSSSMGFADQYADAREATAVRAVMDEALGQPDGAPIDSPGESVIRTTRYEILNDALSGGAAGGSPLDDCLETNRIAVYQFGSAVRPVSTSTTKTELADALIEVRETTPVSQTTDIVGALERVIGQARVGRLAAIILATDGKSTTPGDYRRLIEKARRRRVSIFPLLVGSSTPAVDLAVGPLLADENVFVKDIVSVRGTLNADLPDAQDVELQFFERRRKEPLSTTIVRIGGDESHTEFEFRARPFRAGEHVYRVVAKALDHEINLENNASEVRVNAVEDKVRVLYVEGYPRFEYRYLKNALLREPTVISSVLLLSADEGFAQEGTQPIQRFPQTEEELFQYDVVIFGDLDPRPDAGGNYVGWLSARQAQLLVDFVGQRGGGFIYLAGPRHGPHAFRGTPLEKLLPVMIDPQYLGLPGEYRIDSAEDGSNAAQGFQLQLTPEGRVCPVFRFEERPDENLAIVEALPIMHWYAPTLGPKPAAEVLAQHPVERTLSGPMPLVVTGRYGAGRIYFHGTDDTWLWRRETGEAFYDTYWLQAIRFCTENRLLSQTRSARLFVDRRRYDFAQPVRMTLQLASVDLAQMLPNEIPARYVSVDRKHGGEFELVRLGPSARRFEGQFTPPAQGGFLVSVDLDLPGAESSRLNQRVEVRATNLELVDRQTDHAILRQLAEQTGGRALYLDELDQLAGLLPDRRVKIPDDLAEPIWDTRFVLGLFVLILSIEWSLRKWSGLI